MTREEEIKQAAVEYINSDMQLAYGDFINGIKWADKHPKNPWRDVKKELPPIKQRVFFLDSKGIPHIGRREVSEQIVVSADTPKDGIILTHWMPIPQIEKGGKV